MSICIHMYICEKKLYTEHANFTIQIESLSNYRERKTSRNVKIGKEQRIICKDYRHH